MPLPRRLGRELARKTGPKWNGRAEHPAHGLPDDVHPDEGLMVALRTYGEAMTFIREWYPRRMELAARARARGIKRSKIARLMRVDQSTIGRWWKKWDDAAKGYDELIEQPPEETGW